MKPNRQAGTFFGRPEKGAKTPTSRLRKPVRRGPGRLIRHTVELLNHGLEPKHDISE
jgi:hypothetical protein